ncbi:hypothetical protein [Aquipseudomonas campi]
MGQPRFNIDQVSDDEFFAVTEGVALAGAAMEEKGATTLLVIQLSDTGNDAILAGTISEQALAKLESLLEQLKGRALEETPGDAITLHLEELPD